MHPRDTTGAASIKLLWWGIYFGEDCGCTVSLSRNSIGCSCDNSHHEQFNGMLVSPGEEIGNHSWGNLAPLWVATSIFSVGIPYLHPTNVHYIPFWCHPHGFSRSFKTVHAGAWVSVLSKIFRWLWKIIMRHMLSGCVPYGSTGNLTSRAWRVELLWSGFITASNYTYELYRTGSDLRPHLHYLRRQRL